LIACAAVIGVPKVGRDRENLQFCSLGDERPRDSMYDTGFFVGKVRTRTKNELFNVFKEKTTKQRIIFFLLKKKKKQRKTERIPFV